MKPSQSILAASALLFALTTAPAFSQGGPLTPPVGAPAPTMKSLDLIEPRIPLVDESPGVSVSGIGQITISEPGSYYLVENVDISLFVTGIRIQADAVTLDLNGHSIRYIGGGNGSIAIDIHGSNVTVKNGHIISTTTHDGSSFTTGGFQRGVDTSLSSDIITVRNLSIQGVRSFGIFLRGASSLVENCKVFIGAQTGISNSKGIVKNSIVQTSGSNGIQAHSVIGCLVDEAEAIGINASIVANSIATSTGGSGIFASHLVTASYGRSSSTSSAHHGISSPSGTVTNSRGQASGGHGISATLVQASHGRAQVNARNGIQANLTTHSYGIRSSNVGGRYGISADQANGCRSINGENITHKFNMP